MRFRITGGENAKANKKLLFKRSTQAHISVHVKKIESTLTAIFKM